jgi:hypothetical protein
MSPAANSLDLGATIKGFSPGQKVFNRYTLKKILGRGGMGVVWLARDEQLERDVALKFLPEVVAMDKEAVLDLKRETRRSLELTHPHIVRIYDFIQDAHTAAIAMEFIAGDTLAARKLEQPARHFEVKDLRDWVRDWLMALDYAHTRARVVHRDLKPANLMIDGEGFLKVADFGIAASVSDSVSRVSAQAGSSGTPVYMSPQQMMGEKTAVTDDIYAFGATLYELLTGKPPFYAGNVMLQVQSKVPPAMAERRTELGEAGEPIPPEWESTVAACLSKDAPARPQSASEVAEQLGLIGGVKVMASVPPLLNRAERVGLSGSVKVMPKPAAKVAVAEPVVAAAVKLAEPAEALKGPKRTSKTGLYAGLAAAAMMLGGAGYYFLGYAPEQQRVAELKRLEVMANQAAEAKEKVRMEAEALALRMAEEKRQAETARVAAERRARPQLGDAWENTLGMKFVPVQGAGLLFCIWETRVQDFEAFVSATRYDATGGMWSYRNGKWGRHGETWQSPGFEQGPTHPVVGVNEADAKAFCEWLTAKERKEGRLAADRSYRLSTDTEWEQAVGPGEFPWGSEWPPLAADNYADASAKRKYPGWPVIEGYEDGYADTAPVGSFTANRYGIFDLGGNVRERVGDRSSAGLRVRGASFNFNGRDYLVSSYRGTYGGRVSDVGFRVVVAVGSAR